MDILPCAHCGSGNLQVCSGILPDHCAIECQNCWASSGDAETEIEATAAWNRRAIPAGYKLVPVEAKPKDGWYLQDTRGIIGNCVKFWYTHGYGTKVKNFHVFATKEEALIRAAPWFHAWYKPYIDSLAELTVDCQLLNREQEQLMLANKKVSSHE